MSSNTAAKKETEKYHQHPLLLLLLLLLSVSALQSDEGSVYASSFQEESQMRRCRFKHLQNGHDGFD